jgi:acylphosphatase
MPPMPVIEPEHERWIVHITGRVQGVFFRKSARIEGERLGLAIGAENLTDGSVQIEAEGEPAALETFATWCQTGPPKAEVQSVRIEKQ